MNGWLKTTGSSSKSEQALTLPHPLCRPLGGCGHLLDVTISLFLNAEMSISLKVALVSQELIASNKKCILKVAVANVI